MRFALVVAAMAVASTPALAEDPTGDWMVPDGSAVIRIENCGHALWGFVFWEKEPGGLDSQNPDPAQRERPTLGLPLLRKMQNSAKNPTRWEGEVYNAQNGKTYTSHIALNGPNTLRIEGCVLGILCGGQDWTRTKPDAAMTPNAVSALARTHAAAQHGGSKTLPKPAAAALTATPGSPANGSAAAARPSTTTASGSQADAQDGLCSTLAQLPGLTH